MALNKRIELANGVVVDYHRIVRFDTIVNVQNVIELASYPSRAKRDEEKTAVMSEDPTMDVYIETSIFEIPYDPEMTPKLAYEWIKTNRPEFEDAIDVFEEKQQ